jgi:folate-binding protein YgfZ
MPFKTNRPTALAPRLSGFSLLEIAGPDAGSFLQAQTMNDVRGLDAMHWHWNGWLNAKGRLIALFALLKLADDDYLAVLPDFPAQELAPLLQRFVFRAKLKLRVLDDLICAADLSPADSNDSIPRDQAVGERQSGLRLDWSGESQRRHLLLLPEDQVAPVDPACDAEWLAADLAHGLPRLSSTQRENWTPQMLSLERLQAFSLKKGCYPGQEIVARTHYLGKAKRGLRRIVGQDLALGSSLKDETGAELGVVISTSSDSSSALVVVASTHELSHARIGGFSVEITAFLQGLQRPV